MNKLFSNILVVGIGLIGGSILRTLAGHQIQDSLYGLDLNEDITKEAHSLGLIKNSDNNVDTIKEGSLVIFSVPNLSLEGAFNLVQAKLYREEVLFIDTLSSKSHVLTFLQSNPLLQKNFIMSHPIAGSEKSGLVSSKHSLFKDKLAIICPNKLNEEDSIKKIVKFWEHLGSMVAFLQPEKHDSIFAKTSHLPHVIAYALMNFLFKDLKNKTFSYSGGSLEDYTRIASSDPTMWTGIMVSNKQEVLKALKGFRSSLDQIYRLIESEDQESIFEFLEYVKKSRDTIIMKKD